MGHVACQRARVASVNRRLPRPAAACAPPPARAPPPAAPREGCRCCSCEPGQAGQLLRGLDRTAEQPGASQGGSVTAV